MEKISLVESKYARTDLITWWDQSKLSKSRVLVVGAGALGNEIVKNLTLIGVGHITLVDMDSIEHSNLSRGVFFRMGDEGRFKSEIVAERAMQLNPDVEIHPLTCSIQTLGDAFLSDFDLLVAGLDNREARIWIGAAAQRAGLVWIDAAIEGLQGKVQTFVPGGPCYACTLNDSDWIAINHRKSCTLLGLDEILSGHVPTNATTSSIIAGIQAQEAVKYLVHHKDFYALEGKMWSMFGESMTTFTTNFDLSEDCPCHSETFKVDHVLTLKGDWTSTLHGTEGEVLSFPDEVILISGCLECRTEPKLGYADLMKRQGKCSSCEAELNIDVYSRFATTDECMKLAITADFWPQSFFAEIEDAAGETLSIRINKENHV